MVVPYTKDLSKSFKRFAAGWGLRPISRVLPGGNTIKNLMAPKDRDTITQKDGVIYG